MERSDELLEDAVDLFWEQAGTEIMDGFYAQIKKDMIASEEK